MHLSFRDCSTTFSRVSRPSITHSTRRTHLALLKARQRHCRVRSWRMFRQFCPEVGVTIGVGHPASSSPRHSAPSLLPCLSRLASRGMLFWQETLTISENILRERFWREVMWSNDPFRSQEQFYGTSKTR